MRKFLLVFLLGCFTPLEAAQVAFNFFSQDGFDEGAVVTGIFVGEDLNGDGQLSSFNSEITDFSMQFSGNSLVPAFSLDFDSLFGLVYDLDGGPLGDGFSLDVEGIGAESVMYSYNAGPGPLDQCGVGIACAEVTDLTNGGVSSSSELILVSSSVSPVPIPAAVWLFGSAIFLFVGFMKTSALTRKFHEFTR